MASHAPSSASLATLRMFAQLTSVVGRWVNAIDPAVLRQKTPSLSLLPLNSGLVVRDSAWYVFASAPQSLFTGRSYACGGTTGAVSLSQRRICLSANFQAPFSCTQTPLYQPSETMRGAVPASQVTTIQYDVMR